MMRNHSSCVLFLLLALFFQYFSIGLDGGANVFVAGYTSSPAFTRTNRAGTVLHVKQEARLESSSLLSSLSDPPLPPRPASARTSTTTTTATARTKTRTTSSSHKKRVVRPNHNDRNTRRQAWDGAEIPKKVPRLSDILLNDSKSPAKTDNNKTPTTTPPPRRHRRSPRPAWKAGYYTSLKSQKRIKFAASSTRHRPPLQRATHVLQTFLALPPERCNAANLVCALTLTAKLMGRETSDEFRALLHRTLDVVRQLLLQDAATDDEQQQQNQQQQQQQYLSVRQLCNIAWAIAKHYDRDPTLLPPPPPPAKVVTTTTLGRSTAMGRAETWDLRHEHGTYHPLHHHCDSRPEQRLDAMIDEIASQLTTRLEREGSFVAKEGELCMASWAYGILRRRRRPPGWKQEPKLGQLSASASADSGSSSDSSSSSDNDFHFVRFEQWDRGIAEDECHDLEDPPSPTDLLFDRIGHALLDRGKKSIHWRKNGAWDNNNDDDDDPAVVVLPTTTTTTTTRLQACRWNELANLAWAYASHGRACSESSENLMQQVAREATRRLKENPESKPLSRDVAQIVWALGTLQADNFHLATGLHHFVRAIGSSELLLLMMDDFSGNNNYRPLADWSCPDLVQVALSLAHARIDDHSLLREIYAEAQERLNDEGLTSSDQKKNAANRKAFLSWEVSILLWSQARLHMTAKQGDAFPTFTRKAVAMIHRTRQDRDSLESVGLGPQEQANIAWSLTVLEHYDSAESQSLLQAIFKEAASSCKEEGVIQLEHAHQLWQAMFVLEGESPACVQHVPEWFREYLQEKWLVEKSRVKTSSARHKSLSQLLRLMGVDHANEHDEDIDVAIVVKPTATWSHETDRPDSAEGLKLAVEFDGPNHFTRQEYAAPTGGGGGVAAAPAEQPRALGHTILKYRLLKQQGWTVVRVPYYEFDKIPFWASMERQRYLQRLLKTHCNLRFSDVDVSEYKVPVSNRYSRFD